MKKYFIIPMMFLFLGCSIIAKPVENGELTATAWYGYYNSAEVPDFNNTAFSQFKIDENFINIKSGNYSLETGEPLQTTAGVYKITKTLKDTPEEYQVLIIDALADSPVERILGLKRIDTDIFISDPKLWEEDMDTTTLNYKDYLYSETYIDLLGVDPDRLTPGYDPTDYNKLWKDRVSGEIAGVSSFDNDATLSYDKGTYTFVSASELGKAIYKKDELDKEVYYGVIAGEDITISLNRTKTGVTDSSTINWSVIIDITTIPLDYNKLWKERVSDKTAGVSSFDNNATLSYDGETYTFVSSMDIGKAIYKKDELDKEVYYGIVAEEIITDFLSITRIGVANSVNIDWTDLINIIIPNYDKLWRNRVSGKIAGVSSFDNDAILSHGGKTYAFVSSTDIGKAIYKKDNLFYGVLAKENFATTLRMTKTGVEKATDIDWMNVKNITIPTFLEKMTGGKDSETWELSPIASKIAGPTLGIIGMAVGSKVTIYKECVKNPDGTPKIDKNGQRIWGYAHGKTIEKPHNPHDYAIYYTPIPTEDKENKYGIYWFQGNWVFKNRRIEIPVMVHESKGINRAYSGVVNGLLSTKPWDPEYHWGYLDTSSLDTIMNNNNFINRTTPIE